MMEYKGYVSCVEFDSDAEIFHGEVINTRDVLTFQGTTVDELKQALADTVEDYLEFCLERGEEPDKRFSGKFVVRVDPAIHRDLYVEARARGISLNALATERLRGSA